MKTLEDMDKESLELFKNFEQKVIFTTGKPETQLAAEITAPCYVSRTGISFERLSFTITLNAKTMKELNEMVVKFRDFCKQNSLKILANRDNVKKMASGINRVVYCEFIYESQWG